MSTFLSSSFGAGANRNYHHDDSTAVSDLAPIIEIKRLREENVRLQEDLAQCQVDKEFVWSLWKKLQVASPDVTEAVALVVEREKQKAEDKDRKVLDILRLKDEKISDLQKVMEQQSEEYSFNNQKKLELHDEVARHQTDKARVIDELSDVKRQIELEKTQYEQNTNNLMSTIDELTKTCQGLQDELAKSTVEVDRVTKCLLKAEDENRAQNEEIKALKDQLNTVYTKETRLSDLAKRYESQLKKITTELKSKARELDSARRELSDLWATHHQCETNAQQRESIIRQMEDLQRNTEKMLKDCDSEHAKQTEQQFSINRKLTDEMNYLRQKEEDQQEVIDSLKQALKAAESERDERGSEVDDGSVVDTHDVQQEKWSRLYIMERENEKLQEKLHDKNRVIERLSKQTECVGYLDASSDGEMMDEPGYQTNIKHRRTKSDTGLNRQQIDITKKSKLVEAKLEQTEIRLQLKESQLDALKQAHQRRLTRLKNLLTSYKLVREQLKVAEDELGRPPKKRRLKLSRPKAKQLQHEDKEAAWNELRFVKNENKNLHVIKMNLEEQLDDMAVKSSEDDANLHTLQIQVNTLEEEMKFMRRRGRNLSSTPTKKQQEDILLLTNKLESCKSVIASQQTRLEEILRDNTVLIEEKRTFKFEINTLKKGLYAKKSEMADLQAEINRLRRVSRRNRPVTKASKHSYVSPLAQRYQEVLSQSVANIDAAMTESRSPKHSPRGLHQAHRSGYSAHDERGWISQDEDYNSETLSELDIPEPADSAVSLGEVIARQAAEDSVRTEDNYCQTSPTLLQSLRRSLNERVNRASHTPKSRRTQTNNFDNPPEVVMKDFGTSPLPWKAAPAVRRRRLRNSAFTQVSSLKHRLVSLQLQVKSLSETRDEAKSQAEQLTVTCGELQSQVSTSNTKLLTQRNTIERLESELDTSKMRVIEIQSNIEQMIPKSQSEQDKRLLEHKLKSVTNDLARRNSEVKDLRVELERSGEANTDLSDRLARLERDVSQKRTLLEDLRLKLRLAKESAKSEMQMLEGKTEEVERIKSIMEQNKTTMDSMKSSIKVLTKERKDHENRYKEVQTELTKKEKQLANCQVQVQSLQKEMDSLQETARQQLVALAAQGENAVAIAQDQLVKAHNMIEELTLLIKNISDALIARQSHYREERQRIVRVEKQKARREANKSRTEGDSALTQAKKRAQEILDLSASDIDNLLNSEDDDSDFESDDKSYSQYWKKENNRWVKKWEKALGSENFVQKVTDLFVDKIDEINSLSR